MMALISEVFQYEFMQKALLVGVLIALSSAVLGIFLVLRKMSMIGDGLAHVSFATVAIALLLNQSPLFISIPVVMVASFFILKLNDAARVHGDAAIGLVSSFSVAVGVLISSVSTGFNIDLFSYLFGSILVIRSSEVYLSLFLAAVVIGTVIFFYHDLFAITQDEAFSRVIGIKTKRMNYLISALTAITISLGIRVVGTMLISSMIIFPTVTALQVARSFKETIFLSAFVSVVAVVLGVIGSYVFNLPSGATIVMINAMLFGVFFLIRKWRR
ncbi:metal ABC transporter permease [Fusibacter paucivorans]|uniref:Metal ABC transporter permease n=1 Tax=Fusibacter paucivorans TaxID=76009 RepID=A0ABS5PL60_9FIRM|nr:metal ABC transporter permease [Fusibacter paucivorans]MBS7525051.1 metal ABC transporter permease [Fusibacter paucivorans]